MSTKEIVDFLPGEAIIMTTSKALKNLIIGIGCNKGTSCEEIEKAIKRILKENNLSFKSIHSIATIDKKGNEEGIIRFAKKYNFKVNTFKAGELNKVEGISKSEHSFKATGANAVSEPAAILGGGRLVISKQKMGNVTIAVGELKIGQRVKGKGQRDGKIYIIGTGPGGIEHITPKAQRAIRETDVIVGYKTYLNLIKELIKDKEVIKGEMTEEVDRCKKAIEIALKGKIVSVISGGDPGIYGMAGLVFEILKAEEIGFDVEVIPGIAAFNAVSARLGAPLMNDFASISLSDRLTPWEVIEKRIEAGALADFVIILYNPKSKERIKHIEKARDIILRYRSGKTPVGIVRACMRDNEEIIITDLESMLKNEIDMQSMIIIGNSETFLWKNWIITPRGYRYL